MYSRKRYSDDAERLYNSGYEDDFEEEELCPYNLPPKYDGSRFRRRKEEAPCRKCERNEPLEVTELFEDTTYVTDQEEKMCTKEKEEPFHLLDGLGGEELLIISLMLTVAGGEDSGELLLLLVLLLLHG